METTYQHQELPPGYIRLIRLSPYIPDVDTALHCEIFIVPLEEAPEYSALSYVWGEATVTDKLQCNGGSIAITTNLSLALHQLTSFGALVLWIDQLCIDQSNITERSQQVNMMGRIYIRADVVIMWLGPDPQNYAPIAHAFMKEVEPRFDRIFPEGTDSSDENLIKDGLPERSSIKWTALCNLFQLPYFERIWIIQEVMLASSRILLWGNKDLPWDNFERFLRWLVLSQDLWYSDKPVRELYLMRAVRLTTCPRDLLSLLTLTLTRKATDERDKVYAFLGLDDNAAEQLQADYTKSVKEVFRDVALLLIRRNLVFNVLSHVNHNDEERLSTSEYWPSWVPQWRGGGPTQFILESVDHGWATSATIPLDLSKLSADDLDMISLTGVEFSKVKHLSAIDAQRAQNPEVSQFVQIWDAWRMTMYQPVVLPPKYPLIKALLWTFLCCTMGLGFNPAKWDDRMFLEFASAWAITLIHIDFKWSGSGPACLRDRLDLAELAVLGYEAVSGIPLSPSMMQNREVINGRFEGHLGWIGDMLSPNHSDQNAIQKGARQILSYVAMHMPVSNLMTRLLTTYVIRRFFITASGNIGMGPFVMEEGDIVAILFGGTVPYILRPKGDHYLLVGECYVHGVMEGEAIRDLQEKGELEYRTKVFSIR